MKHEFRAAAGLLGVGAAALLVAGLIHAQQSLRFVDPPSAAGQIGTVYVYAQRAQGPVRLQTGRVRRVVLPQDLAFVWSCDGSGPRIVRIEVEGKKSSRVVVYEEEVSAPADKVPLDYVLRIDRTNYDVARLRVTIEAPHAKSYSWEYGIDLVEPKF